MILLLRQQLDISNSKLAVSTRLYNGFNLNYLFCSSPKAIAINGNGSEFFLFCLYLTVIAVKLFQFTVTKRGLTVLTFNNIKMNQTNASEHFDQRRHH